MSKENVEIVREGFSAWQRGDFDALLETVDSEIEIVQPPEVPDSKTYRGKAGMVEAFEDWPKQWEEFSADLVDVIDVSDDKVVSVTLHHLRARDIDIDQEVAYVHTFRGGLVLRWEMFLTREAALEAAGLPA